MRKIVTMMVVLGLLVALTLVIGVSVASAKSDGSYGTGALCGVCHSDANGGPHNPSNGLTPAQCLACHKGDPAGAAGYAGTADASTKYMNVHDSSVGECMTCHTYEDESIHGQWDDTPEACARCHRTHSAVEDDLLVMGKDALCKFCHGRGPGLAQTNVLDGLLRLDSGSLRAGGFENATMETSTHLGDNSAGHATTVGEWQFPVSGAAEVSVTSKHTLGPVATIWGAWNAAGFSASPNAGDTTTVLECVSCHDPHAYGQTYRMLTRRPGDSGVVKHPVDGGDPWTQRVFVTDQLTYAEYNPLTDVLAYTTPDYSKLEIGDKTWDGAEWVVTKVPGTSYATVDVLDGGGAVIPVNLAGGGTADMFSQQLAAWCASCHDRYNAQSTADTGDAIFAHRHQTAQEVTESAPGVYDAADSYGGKVKDLSCVSCHVAHGTTSFMTPYVTAMPWPGQGYPGNTASLDVRDDAAVLGAGLPVDLALNAGNATDHDGDSRSNLLRIDNRGVCQNPACHPKGKEGYLEPYN